MKRRGVAPAGDSIAGRSVALALAGLVGSALLAGAAPAAAGQSEGSGGNPEKRQGRDAGQPDLTGVWSIVRPEDILKTEDGKLPPLLPEARTVYETHQAMAAKGDRSFDSTTHCLPPGLPRLMLIRSPFEILQRPNTIYFVHELNRLPRRVYLNEKLPTDVDPHYLGYSVAHWDADALVIESSGFEDGTLLDAAGLPHSDALHLTERYQLDKDGKHLHAHFTIDDSKTFSAPWSFKAEYVKRPGYELHEDVCADKQKPHLLAQ